MGGRTFERKAPFATTSFKKGGGCIFEGGLIFGRLRYVLPTPLFLEPLKFIAHGRIFERLRYMHCVTCLRSGPNWRGLKELLGHWRDQPMLPVASTMERSNLSCWSLGGWIRMEKLCRMHGSWISILGGGER